MWIQLRTRVKAATRMSIFNVYNTMDGWIRVPIEVRTQRELGKIYSFSFGKCFIVIYSPTYLNLLQIIIKDIEIEKVRCVFFKQLNWFRCVRIQGYHTWRPDFPTVDSSKPCIYLCHIVEFDTCK